VECIGLSLLMVRRGENFMEWDNKIFGSEKCRKFLD
jgi:hypothetical protein